MNCARPAMIVTAILFALVMAIMLAGPGGPPANDGVPAAYDGPAATTGDLGEDPRSYSTGTRSYGVSAVCNDTHKTTGSNDRVRYDVAFENTGDEEETLYFEAELIELVAPEGTEPEVDKWSFWMDADEYTLAAGEWFTLKLTVEAQCGCQAGISALVEVTGSVSMDLGVHDSVVTNTTKGGSATGPGSSFDLRVVIPDDAQVDSRVLSYALNISGEWVENDTLALSVSHKPQGWTATLSVNGVPVGPASGQYLDPVRLDVTIPQEVDGDYYSIIVEGRLVRDDSAVDSESFTIPIFPDLKVADLDLDVSEPAVGSETTVNISVANDGIGIAGPFEVRTSAGDRVLDQRQIDGLESHGTASFSIPWTPLSGDGDLKVVVDPEARLDEIDDGNNVKKLVVDIVDPSDGDDDADPDADADGGVKEEEGLSRNTMIALGAVVIILVGVLGTIASAKAALGGPSGRGSTPVQKKDGTRKGGHTAKDGEKGEGGPKGEGEEGKRGRSGEGSREGKRAEGKSEKGRESRGGKRRGGGGTRGGKKTKGARGPKGGKRSRAGRE